VYADGVLGSAALRGRLKQSSGERVLVGDGVRLAVHGDGSLTIEEVMPRRTLLKRRAPGRSRGVRNVAANVDQVVVVGAARDPVWAPQLVDRFVAVAAANGLPVVVVVNKCDLVADAEPYGAPYLAAGYPVLRTSAKEHRGLEDLRSRLERSVSLLTGSTGVGKSSLLNALEPGLKLRTADVSARSRSGRHATVTAEMHPVGSGGYVVDTPGLRDIGLWGLEPEEVAAAFPEFANWSDGCRFDNCRHLDEPECGVWEAVDRGELARSRLDSYRRLLNEAYVAARPWVRDRRGVRE
jgi:ribosome biogenesis GTPase